MCEIGCQKCPSEDLGWTTKWPKEKGLYWFYGYRFGKISCGDKEEPILAIVDVWKISNAFLYFLKGHALDQGQVEEAHFQKAILPELPEID